MRTKTRNFYRSHRDRNSKLLSGLGSKNMSANSPINPQSNLPTNFLPVLQERLQKFLDENEARVDQAHAQIVHAKALLASLASDTIAIGNQSDRHKTSSRPPRKTPKTKKRPSLFGSDKDKILIGKKFDEPLTEFQDYI